MQKFISCDWGTTSFRLRLIDAATQNILAETCTQQGIAAIYAFWKSQQHIDRVTFYCNYISHNIIALEAETKLSLTGLPVIISGMASSTIGMKELAYKKIPFEIKPANLLVDVIKATPPLHRDIILISGVCSANDVVRGEETILAGCTLNNIYKQHLFILPGTHSKHVTIENGFITYIKTFMTGEVFQLLSTKSILSNSVEQCEAIECNLSFMQGVQNAATASLLNNIFHVRTNTLFNTKNKIENYAYLSGLLIGEELKTIEKENVDAISILSAGSLSTLYTNALNAIGINTPVLIEDADKALINAHTILYNSLNK